MEKKFKLLLLTLGALTLFSALWEKIYQLCHKFGGINEEKIPFSGKF